MNELTNVGPSTQTSLDIVNSASLTGELNKLSGAGKAYQSVSQSTAIAIQDATDNLRNINTMATTAMGVAISQMLATGKVDDYAGIIEAANKMVENGTKNFGEVGSSASNLLDKFPSGGS
ncbi:hypothetical protein [Pseudoalteromonas luteoviolacea]|uniref:Uncharacterized protein n=2 Tax=Pseudoalteromonas luteoviolacea TaxID=43657 RepID=A0A167MZN9_9GAMM|nr:hypothetical protein [Pseudoalteromonas luteoviolacea]KZN51644.1 hypothetical protein N476_12515 [Pseudoalteromonas luteoviolacea H33]KZN67201.1 hypothetical protein N473_08240 [Pseudoalteromonas luteoviolacea CPMOR-1]KZN79099.1 hypothetical protein N477_06255 [Pseudoalteromonas luteoviolacea H33-S]MBQ4878225.1 hypothetical protein [Pseudoalteromonas luteoviolacea]MBQ4907380.1 hypothetical protein [Pseudoalteromonas luteoviolacea]